MTPALTINFSNPTGSDGDALILEQIPWDNYIGKVTKGAMVGYLKSMMYGYDEPRDAVNCGIVDDIWTGVVMAYPRDPELVYTMGVSHGTVSEGIREEIEFVELVNFKISDSAKLKYFSQGLIAAEFVGNVYDNVGSIIANPTIDIDGNAVTLSEVAFAILRITYRVVAFGHSVTVPKRETSEKNKYTSVAYANYDGNVVWIELDPPPSADEYDKKCGWSYKFSPFDDDDDCLPPAIIEYRYSKINYCTGQYDLEAEEKKTREDPDYICR